MSFLLFTDPVLMTPNPKVVVEEDVSERTSLLMKIPT
jgi:hypothetical protein